MSFNFGGFLFFNALCDLFNKLTEADTASQNDGMSFSHKKQRQRDIGNGIAIIVVAIIAVLLLW